MGLPATVSGDNSPFTILAQKIHWEAVYTPNSFCPGMSFSLVDSASVKHELVKFSDPGITLSDDKDLPAGTYHMDISGSVGAGKYAIIFNRMAAIEIGPDLLYDFGSFFKGSTLFSPASPTFEIMNKGDVPVTAISITSSDSHFQICTTVPSCPSIPPFDLAPGTALPFRIKFSAGPGTGCFSAKIEAKGSSSLGPGEVASPVLNVKGKAVPIPVIALYPNSYQFPFPDPQQVSSLTLIIKSMADVPVIINDISSSDQAVFPVSPTALPFQLPALGERAVQVGFNPKLPLRPSSAMITVSGTGDDGEFSATAVVGGPLFTPEIPLLSRWGLLILAILLAAGAWLALRVETS